MSNPVCADVAVGLAPEPDDDVTKGPVVHVHAAPPGNAQRVDAGLVPVQDVRLEDRRQQVVRHADRMHVAREVEVEILHGNDLRVTTAGRAALDPEDRSERRFAEAEDGLRADGAETLRQRDGRRGLPLARSRRRDRRDTDELAVCAGRAFVERGQIDLRLEGPVELDLVRLETRAGGDLGDRP